MDISYSQSENFSTGSIQSVEYAYGVHASVCISASVEYVYDVHASVYISASVACDTVANSELWNQAYEQSKIKFLNFVCIVRKTGLLYFTSHKHIFAFPSWLQ